MLEVKTFEDLTHKITNVWCDMCYEKIEKDKSFKIFYFSTRHKSGIFEGFRHEVCTNCMWDFLAKQEMYFTENDSVKMETHKIGDIFE